MVSLSGANRPDLHKLRIDDRHRQKKSTPWLRWFIVGVALLVAGVGGAIGISHRGRGTEVAVVQARAVGSGTSAALLNASGYVTPRQRATVAAKVTGRVVEIHAEEGMEVEQEQILARLDDAEARLQLKAAQTQLDVARAAIKELRVNLANADRELRRAKQLHEDGFTSVEALDAARTVADGLRARMIVTEEQIRAAESQVALAQQNLDNYTIRAPFAGIVVSKDAQVGEMVSPISAGGGYTRTGIATIVDMTSLEIQVDVNESYIARVSVGQRVEAVLDAYPSWKIPARVRTVIPSADRQKATVKVRIAFDQLESRILPDMGVKVAFLAEQTAETANESPAPRALLPQTAIRQAGNQSIVFLVRNGTVERRAVSVGESRGSDREIFAGISVGDLVVNGGPDTLADGQRIRVKD